MDHRRVASAGERVSALCDEYAALLRDGAAPPRAEAVIFRAITLLPGVTLKKNAVDLEGRKAIAIKDHTGHALDGTWTVKKGGVLNLQVRTASRTVDKPGRTS
ncbi:hypothetical protein [Actinoallomurus acaciae]|uniref:Uncharacterized protein n=1 Tax=Actinoallomurus acaciae TaxID=502577 RepID=A0ABV5Y775_9ACTN